MLKSRFILHPYLPVGWGATHVGGFPDLSDVALERSVTQHQQDYNVGFRCRYTQPTKLQN
jgi:hypothetical protein